MMKTRRQMLGPALVAALAVITACSGSPSSVASHSPTPAASTSPQASASASAPAQPPPAASPTPSIPPVNGAYGVLVTQPSGGQYTISIVGVDGKIAASKVVAGPAAVSCANSAAALVPLPVSTSNSSVYYLEASGGVTRLLLTGQVQQAASVPAPTASRRAMFSISPDDQKIAVVVADFNSTGASTRLYVENLDGSAHADLFSEAGAYTLWPIGWHGTNNLVVAKVPSCTQGGGPFCCGPLELHVVDPTTANRRFTIGSSSSCVIVGPASPAGAVCENTPNFTTAQELNWTAGVITTFSVSGPSPAFISPEGKSVAVVSYTTGVTTIRVGGSINMAACEWIDGTHLLAGGDAQQQPRVGNVTNGSIVPVAAQGDCGGRLPGGL